MEGMAMSIQNKEILFICLVLILLPYACSGTDSTAEYMDSTIELTSDSFADSSWIPEMYTCEGEDISPHLAWGELPDSTKSLALICDDPDAPMKTWVHWVVYHIPVSMTELSEDMADDPVLDSGIMQGTTDFGRTGYGGPCPPRGKPHRYFFTLYALDELPELEPGAPKKELLKAMDGHILGRGILMGTYQRK
jgi:Raf kinase inhibitor-like YbhB/YbcL family protein